MMKKDKNEIPTMTGQEAFNAVVDHLLGEDYYIVDPISNAQANPIILKDIKKKYISMSMKRRICKTILTVFICIMVILISFSLGCLFMHFIN